MRFLALILSLLLPLNLFAQVGTTQIQTDTVVIGKPTNVNKVIQFKKSGSGSQPAIRYGQGTASLEFSNDGSSFEPFAAGIPSGAVMAFAMSVCPTGWLAADGSAVSRATEATLFANIRTAFGAGDGSTTFNLPLLQGVFIRGATLTASSSRDPGSGNRGEAVPGTFNVSNAETTNGSPTITVSDTSGLAPGQTVTGTNIPGGSYIRSIDSATTFRIGNQSNSAYVNATGSGTGITLTVAKSASGNYLGSFQGHAFQTHNHSVNDPGHRHTVYAELDGNAGQPPARRITPSSASGNVFSDYSSTGITIQNAAASGTFSQTSTDETRPVNLALLYCIKR